MQLLDAARVDFKTAIRLAPEDARAYNNLGTMLQDSNELSAALTLYRLALEREPRSAEILINIGSVLQVQGHMSTAAEHHHRALAIDPRQSRAHFNLGVIDHFLGRDREAIEHLDEAIRLRAGYAEAYHHRATVRLSQGDFDAGWRDFEWRFRCSNYPQRRGVPLGDMPRWDGSPLAGRRLLIYAEQGLGDTLQFIRYVRRLEQRGDDVVVEVPGVLLPLLTASGFRNLVAAGSPPPRCDVQIPLLSVPGLVGLPPEAIGVTIPYLTADPRRLHAWREQLGNSRRLRIGIVWQGRTSYAFDRVRSIPLTAFAPLAQVEGVELISLQKNAGSEQIAALGGRFTVNDLGSRLDSDGGAFMDTAAVMSNLDLIITSDTAAAHLAGGLGLNVWLALSTPAEWRWLYQRADSPWYPTMRLFRQPREGDWAGVFELMKRELTSLVRVVS
jgi:Flp pilus assembly protein TadD